VSGYFGRRDFLSRGWKLGAGLIGASGVWTSWDVLQARETSGLGGVFRAVPEDVVPPDSTVYVREAQAYLTRVEGEIVALWQRCPHLGCRVAWCESAGQFECPCHGSTFNRVGEHRTGPAPSGMQRFEVAVVDGVVEVDTGAVSAGAPLGAESIDEPVRGPLCLGDET
jgi:nitrite reductase/ring-hydroxylating ferredoxin subunit